MIILFIILYSVALGLLCGFVQRKGCRWFHILALNLCICFLVTLVVAEHEKGQLSDAPMYQVAFIVMVSISTLITLVVWDLSKTYFEPQ